MRWSMSLTGSCFSSESALGPFHHGIRRRGGTISWAALPSVRWQVQADIRTHLIHRPARDIIPLGGALVFSYRVILNGFHAAAAACFSNRPFGVKRFQTIHPSMRWSMSLTGSCFSSESALGPFHHGIRRRGGTISWAALPSVRWQVQADIRTHLIHRPARDIIPLGGALVFSYRVILNGFHAAAAACFSNRPFGVKRFQTIHPSMRWSMSLTGSCFSSESALGPFHHGIRRRGGTISWAALPSVRWQVQADIRTHLIHRPARDIIPLGGALVFSYRVILNGFHAAAAACFSNRPFGVKRFQTIHPSMRWSMSLTGSCFSSESALGPFHHGIRRRGGTISWAALPSVRWQVQADIRTHLIHRPARDIIPLGGALVFSYQVILNGFHAAAAACSRVQRNSVPATQMRCMITASRRAKATIAFFIPRRLAICMAQALSQDHFRECIMLCAAS